MRDEGVGCEGHDWSFDLVHNPILVSLSNSSSFIITFQTKKKNHCLERRKKVKDSHSSTQSSLGPLWSGFSSWALTRWAHSSKWCFKGAHWAECSHSVYPVGGHVSNVWGVRAIGQWCKNGLGNSEVQGNYALWEMNTPILVTIEEIIRGDKKVISAGPLAFPTGPSQDKKF